LIGGGQFAQLRDGCGYDFERGRYFLWRGVATEAEAYAGASFFCAEANGSQNMRGFDGA
jgi:hypothetical protein